MCGRVECHIEFSKIVQSFGISKSSAAAVESAYHPSYNIAPSRNILIVTADERGERHLESAIWGLIPVWAKDPAIGHKMINARAETVAEKPSFRDSFKRHRCLIVANGFFEWRHEGLAKFPVYIRLKSQEPLAFAGLYSRWRYPEGEEICTCTIITTEANEVLQAVHDRMPVILPADQYDLWLDPKMKDKDKLLPLLKPYPSEEIEFYEVSLYVNKPGNDSPELIEAVKRPYTII
jgi:putative SOS response-associated peptidase YedK